MHRDEASPALHATPAGETGDTTARLLRAVTSLAHSVAVQIAATAAVTVAVATIPWLHERETAPAAPAAASTAAASPVPGALELAGILPSSAFPMEGDARFGVALHRTYRIVADTTWSDGTPVETAQQAAPPRPSKRRAMAQGPGREEPSGAPAAVAVLPPERPVDLAIAALPRERPGIVAQTAAPEVQANEPRQDGMLGRVADLGLPDLPHLPLPALPSVREVSHGIDSSAAEARDVVTRTASWAADGVSTIMPRF